MKWSIQQEVFLNWCQNGKGSCVLEAVAGAGKTTTILEAAVTKLKGQVAMLAYNKKIADEISGKLKDRNVDWKKAQAGTVHSFGFSAFRKAYPSVKVENRKVETIADEFLISKDELVRFREGIIKLVGLAKQRALGVIEKIEDTSAWLDIIDHFDVFSVDDENVEPPYDELIDISKKILKKNNSITSEIDFDDMVYLPVYLGLRFWQFDVVIIDEAQDTNPARRALVRALVKKGGRVIAVGDRHQAIYGFTGADSNSLDLIKKDFNAIELPLTTTYRCPKKVVDVARQWVSHISAADTAPEGKVSSVTHEDYMKSNSHLPTDAILCRNNAPLVEMAFALIRKRVACKVEGRDIGQGIKKLITRWKVTTLDALDKKLDKYFEREQTKLTAKGQEVKLQMIEDQIATVRVIIEQCRIEKKYSVADAVAYVDTLFADDVKGVLTLTSIHKSKGREFPRVFWLDRKNTCPSKWARKDWQIEQENNLQYVAATRAQEELIDIVC